MTAATLACGASAKPRGGGRPQQFADSSASGRVQQVATGYSSANGLVGGLVGYAGSSPMQDVSASGNVSGGDTVGGLAGQVSSSPITRGSASGHVSGADSYSGGLVGRGDSSALTDVSAAGTVTAGSGSYHGGLAGYLYRSDVTRGHASGDDIEYFRE